MPSATTAHAALGIALPERVVTNEEVGARIGRDPAWIETRTGIVERRWAGPQETLASLATAAGADAIERSGIAKEEIDLLLLATSTADAVFPNAAPLVATALGLEHAAPMDVGVACTGFVAALDLAAGQLEAGRAQHALVIGADLLSRIVDPEDRGTALLFADGAGAMVVGGRVGPRFGAFRLGTEGAGAAHIVAPHGGVIEMAGQETFLAAVKRLTQIIPLAAADSGWDVDDVDLFVVHQANARILRAVGERLGLDAGRVVNDIARRGNTSAATIPLALHAAEQEGRLVPGAKVVVAAFGAGFTWGAGAFAWGPGA
jgi:3-oxoacyl-[acyl-carrier-protein] synthase-3